MSVAVINTEAFEGGSLFVTFDFEDENGDAIAPDTAAWTLLDMSGNVINSRQDVMITTPTASETVVLSGDDLAVPATETASVIQRRIKVEGMLDGKPFASWADFNIYRDIEQAE